MNEISFYYYPANIKITKPSGRVTLDQFVEANRNPRESIQDLFKKIQVAGEKEKGELKQQLFYFTPCIDTDGEGRSYSNITDFSTLCVLEFDKIPEFASYLRDWIFDNFKACICSYLSPSGKGVKTIWKIDKVLDVETFKTYFYGLANKFSKIKGFDGSSQNPALSLYLSWDKDFRYRPYEEAETWNTRGYKIGSFKVFEGSFEVPEEITDSAKEEIINKITFLTERISDNAHPQIRSVALIGGGYCSGEGFPLEEMEDLICDLISSNEYMIKNVQGYCSTARDFLRKGYNSPLTLDDDNK